MARILIAGGPRTGKTTLAGKIAKTPSHVLHGDDLINRLEWSAASEEISHWFDRPGEWIIEGVQIARALRKWFARNPKGTPATTIYYRLTPLVNLSKGQSAMAKGCEKVWNEILPQIHQRGIQVLTW